MRTVNGILFLDKPTLFSSNQALQCVKRLFRAKKAGHGGTLDPLASGMLIIGFGKATQLLTSYLNGDKTYEVRAKLGIQTTTGDAEGSVIATSEPPVFSIQKLQAMFSEFHGEITQIPPMYSALKYKGVPLYEWARKGMILPRQPRQIHIYTIQLIQYDYPLLSLLVRCGKGTYIRTLIEDMGMYLGCGAHVVQLRRTQIGDVGPEKMITLSRLEILAKEGDVALDSVTRCDACSMSFR